MRSVTVADSDADGREDLLSTNVNLASAQFGLQTAFKVGATGIGALTTVPIAATLLTRRER